MFRRKDCIITYNTDRLVKSNEELANRVAASNKALGDRLEAISAADLRERDRVDISLAEYEAMKYELESLRAITIRLNFVNEFFIKNFQVPIEEMRIMPETIDWNTCYDPINLETTYAIRFKTKGKPSNLIR